jgi:hypothetical protein
MWIDLGYLERSWAFTSTRRFQHLSKINYAMIAGRLRGTQNRQNMSPLYPKTTNVNSSPKKKREDRVLMCAPHSTSCTWDIPQWLKYAKVIIVNIY